MVTILQLAALDDIPANWTQRRRPACCTLRLARSWYWGLFGISVRSERSLLMLGGAEHTNDLIHSGWSWRGSVCGISVVLGRRQFFSKLVCREGRKTNTNISKSRDTLLENACSGGGSLGVSVWPDVSFQESSLCRQSWVK